MPPKVKPTMRGSLNQLLSGPSQEEAKRLSDLVATRLTPPDGVGALPTIGQELRVALAELLFPQFELAMILRRLRASGAAIAADQLSQLTLKILLCFDLSSEASGVSFWNLWEDLIAVSLPRVRSAPRGRGNVWASYIHHVLASGRTSSSPKQTRSHLVQATLTLSAALQATLCAGAEAAHTDGVLVRILFSGRKSYEVVHQPKLQATEESASIVFRELRRRQRRIRD